MNRRSSVKSLPMDKLKREQLKQNRKTFRNHSVALIRESTVTGVAPIFKSRSPFRKSVKMLILVVGVTGFLYQTYDFLKLYWEYSTVASISNTARMKKPAITICDENLISRKFFCETYSHLCQNSSSVLGNEEGFCKLFPYCLDPRDEFPMLPIGYEVKYEDEYFAMNFTKDSGFKIEKGLLTCKWIVDSRYRNKTQRIRSEQCGKPKFVRGMNADKLPGSCYSLGSTIGNASLEIQYLKRGTRLQMTLKWKNSDYNNVGPDLVTLTKPQRRVYFISFHNPRELSNPFIRDSIRIEDRKLYKVRVTETESVRLPPPYSTRCYNYFQDWEKNKGAGPLTREDCRAKCEIDNNFKYKKCVPRGITYPHEQEICPDILEYDRDLNLKIQQCSDECRDACYELRFVAKSEVADQLTIEEAIEKYDTPHVATLEIHFDVLRSSVRIDKPKYESVELFSYMGGYLGMWLGWSLMALCDFFEILFCILIYACKAKRRMKQISVKPSVYSNY